MNGKRCIEKAKTEMARKTLDPFYQQLLAFKENCRGCILQVRYIISLFVFLVVTFFYLVFVVTTLRAFNFIILLRVSASGDSVG